ncbi:MAG: hypothetical protein GY870_15295, partial [archaeon]|nr:hypothetical protein [archaeon]
RQEQLKYKPDILYYRQVQGYLVFLLRYPDILRVQEHDEIQQTIKFLENKNYLIKTLYFDLAKEQTEVFENEEFKKELEKKMEQKEYKLP